MWMQFVPLIAGSNLRFLWRVAPGLLLLALLLSMAGLISFAIRARKHMKSLTPEPPRPQLITGQTVTTAQEIRRLVICWILASSTGLGVGYYWRDHQFSSNRYHYEDVVVVERLTATDFVLQPSRMKPWHAHTCTPQDWQAGEKMRSLYYRYTPNCTDVGARGDFQFYAEHGKRINYKLEAAND